MDKLKKAIEIKDTSPRFLRDIRTANKEKLATSSLEIERLCAAVKTLATNMNFLAHIYD